MESHALTLGNKELFWIEDKKCLVLAENVTGNTKKDKAEPKGK